MSDLNKFWWSTLKLKILLRSTLRKHTLGIWKNRCRIFFRGFEKGYCHPEAIYVLIHLPHIVDLWFKLFQYGSRWSKLTGANVSFAPVLMTTLAFTKEQFIIIHLKKLTKSYDLHIHIITKYFFIKSFSKADLFWRLVTPFVVNCYGLILTSFDVRCLQF